MSSWCSAGVTTELDQKVALVQHGAQIEHLGRDWLTFGLIGVQQRLRYPGQYFG
jgi:hypothetical protein